LSQLVVAIQVLQVFHLVERKKLSFKRIYLDFQRFHLERVSAVEVIRVNDNWTLFPVIIVRMRLEDIWSDYMLGMVDISTS